MTERDKHVVILGAGQAGGAAAALLRQYGHEGRITLIGDEPSPPYQRPPLSKAYFKGEMEEERLYLRPRAFYDDKDITLKLGVSAEAVDRDAQTVTLTSGETLSYDHLIFAQGSRARMLPVDGADLAGVQVLRTLEDVDALRPNAVEGKSLVVVGAGYIGLEAAAVAVKLGLKVTVLEALDRVLARVTSPVMSQFYQDQHAKNGVDIRLQARMSGFVGEAGKLTGVKMADDEIIPADIALVGIGILPNQELAMACGVACDDGILVDEDARTDDPSIFAIGDCARRPLVHYGTVGRLESVHNALEQAKLAASAICGKPRPNVEAPWFWSDQYDLKLQTAGLLTGYDDYIVRGDPETGKFAVYYLKDGVFLAVDAVNSAPDFLMGKKMVGAGARPDIQALKDTEQSIKDIVQAALAAAQT